MTPLAEIVRDAVAGKTDPNTVTDTELATCYAAYEAGYRHVFAILIAYCGDYQAARAELSRTLDLPLSVLQRRADEAAAVVNAGEIPSAPRIAAHAAVILREMFAIKAMFEARRSGATVQ